VANSVAIAGHVVMAIGAVIGGECWAFISSSTSARLAMVVGLSRIRTAMCLFAIVEGHRGGCEGFNRSACAAALSTPRRLLPTEAIAGVGTAFGTAALRCWCKALAASAKDPCAGRRELCSFS